MTKNKTFVRSYMSLEFAFSGLRLYDSFMTPVDWEISADLIALGRPGSSKAEVELTANTACQKLYFWLYTNLPNAVFVGVDSETDLYTASLMSNISVHCPESSSDNIIARVLHSKLAILAQPDILLPSITLKASDSSIRYHFDPEDGGYDLPSTTEYYTAHPVRHTEPWWARNDGFSFELSVKKESEDDGFVDPLIEFYKIKEESVKINESDNIIQIEKWKPKKV